MKNIFALLAFVFISVNLLAQTTQYFDGTDWRDAPDGGGNVIVGGGPTSITGFYQFIIEANGYESSGSDDKALTVTVEDGGLSNLFFTVSGNFSVLQLITEDGSGYQGVACYIKNGGELLLSNVTPSIIPKTIAYEGPTSVLSLYEVTPDLNTVFPGNNGGYLKLNQSNHVYDFGNEDIVIDNDRVIDILATGITIMAQSMVFNTDVNLSPSAENAVLDIYNDITIASGYSFETSTTGISLLSSNGRVVVQPGAKIVTNNNSGTINKLTLEGSSSAQGIIVGTGFTCSDVTMSVVPNWSRGDATWGDFAWREFGSPFSKSIYSSDVTWGGANETNIKGNDGADVDPGNGGNGSNSYINYWDSSAQLWKVPATGTGSGTGPYTSTVNFNSAYEVWYDGNGSNSVTVTNGTLSSHNSNYAVSATSGSDDWSLMPNPYASFLDLGPVQGQYLGAISQGSAVSVLTNVGGYSYKTYAWGGGTLGKSSIAPFQAFWIVNKATSGTGTIIASGCQVDATNGQSIAKKLDYNLPPNIFLKLENNEGYAQEVVGLFFKDDGGSSLGLAYYDTPVINGLGKVATMSVMHDDGNTGLIFKENNYSKLSTDYYEGLKMIGETPGSYNISISRNELDASYKIYILDKQEDVTHLLNTNDYSFNHDPSNEANRFEIQITSESLGESEKIETSSIKLVNKGNVIEFVMPSTTGIESVQFVSLNGQVVKTVQANKGQTEFNVSDFNSGVYIAQLKLESGNVASYKFVK